MALQALIWDVDGTLADTELHGHRVAFNLAFAEAGLSWQWDEALYLDLLAVTGGKERIQAWWQRVDPVAAAAPTTAERIRALHARKTLHYTALVAAGQVVLRPGVQRLINEARAAGLRQAIATTTSPDNVQALLAATLGPQAQGWFEVVGAGDVVPHKKPAPDIYHWVLERLALPATACVAIEDSAPGATAAMAAGLSTLVTRSAASVHDRLPESTANRQSGLLLADLNGLGMPGQQAAGLVGGQAWCGVVDVGWLRHRCAALPGAWAGRPA